MTLLQRVHARFDAVAKLVVTCASIWILQLLFHEVLHIVFALLHPGQAAGTVVLNPFLDPGVCSGHPACTPIALAGDASTAAVEHRIIYPAQWLFAVELLWGFSHWFHPRKPVAETNGSVAA